MEVAAVACLPRNEVSAFKTRMATGKDMGGKLAEVVRILDCDDQMRQLFEDYRPTVEEAIDNIRTVVSDLGAGGFLRVG